MMQRLLFGGLLLCLILCGAGAVTTARACAGYTLNLGSDGSLQQELLMQIFSQLISQRTGTTIQLVRYESQAELLAAASRHEVDLLVTEVDSTGAIANRRFSADPKLLLLEPFGDRNFRLAPVFQAETLKRFPALKRLINRLAGLLDEPALQGLDVAAASNPNLREVAHQFLTAQKMIFGG